MSDSLWLHRLRIARLPCPSPSPRVCSNSCPLSRLCHQTIFSSVVPFLLTSSFPALGSFPMSQLFSSGGQSIRDSASASVFTMNIHDWFRLLVWSPCCPRDSQELLQHHSSKLRFFSIQLFFFYGETLTSIHDYWKKHSFD